MGRPVGWYISEYEYGRSYEEALISIVISYRRGYVMAQYLPAQVPEWQQSKRSCRPNTIDELFHAVTSEYEHPQSERPREALFGRDVRGSPDRGLLYVTTIVLCNYSRRPK